MFGRFAVPSVILAWVILPPAGSGFSHEVAAAGIIELRNDRWEQVQVEVRIGPSDRCATHPAIGVHSLRLGEVWAVVSNDVVCWRRGARPGTPDGVWTGWVSTQVPMDSVRRVSL
ncbi:MAG: hypothetical protein ACREMW_03410 [Gemmatimonadales bacterium]